MNLIKNIFIALILLAGAAAGGWFLHKPSLSPEDCISRTLEVGGGAVRAAYICTGQVPLGHGSPQL